MSIHVLIAGLVPLAFAASLLRDRRRSVAVQPAYVRVSRRVVA